MNNFLKRTNDFVSWIKQRSDNELLGAILLTTFLCYNNIFFGHEFFTYDDNWYIYENKNVINFSWQSIKNMFTTIQGGQYSPIGELYHFILYACFGKNAIAFKFFALLNHLLNAVLVFTLFKYLFKDRWLILFVSFVFAIHPVQVETISWLSVIYRIAVSFMLVGLISYARYVDKNRKIKYLLLSFLCFILALFTKEQAVLFPLGVFLVHLQKRHPVFKLNVIKYYISFFVISAVFALITLQITKSGGPSVVDRNITFIQKLQLLSECVTNYIIHFIYPFNLSYSYQESELNLTGILFRIFLLVVVLAISIFTYIKKEQLRFGILWFYGFLTIAFTFSFFHLRDTYMADRYMYFAIIGIAYVLYYVLKYINQSINVTFRLDIALSTVFITLCMGLTANRVTVFKNNERLWTDVLQKDPNNQYANNSLGYYYSNNSQPNKALMHYKRAIELAPEYYLTHSNIGKVYVEQKEYNLALKHVNEALRLNPSYNRGYKNRAALNLILKDHKAVIKDLNYLISKDSTDTNLLTQRYKSFFALKKYKEAIQDALKVNALDPYNHMAYFTVGHSNYLLKEYRLAEVYLTKAIDLNNKISKYYYVRSLSRMFQKKMSAALVDAIKAKELGYKVSKNYLAALLQINSKP